MICTTVSCMSGEMISLHAPRVNTLNTKLTWQEVSCIKCVTILVMFCWIVCLLCLCFVYLCFYKVCKNIKHIIYALYNVSLYYTLFDGDSTGWWWPWLTLVLVTRYGTTWHPTHHLTLAQDEQTSCSVILIIANIVNPVSHNILEFVWHLAP